MTGVLRRAARSPSLRASAAAVVWPAVVLVGLLAGTYAALLYLGW